MEKLFKLIGVLTVLVIFIGTLGFLYQKSRKRPVVFQTELPLYTDIVKKTVASGIIRPRREVEIKSNISGIIREVVVTPGDKIKKGDLIATVKIIPDMISLNNAESRLKRASINLDDNEKTYHKKHALYNKGIIAQTSYQKAQLALNKAREELLSAKNHLQLIKHGATKKYSKTTNTAIRATIDGMVLAVAIKEGDSVIECNKFNDGTTVATIADMNEMIFKGKVDESEVGKLRRDMKMLLTIGAIENETFVARLEHISPKGREENGVVRFEIIAKVALKPSFFIRSGYSANADIVVGKRKNVLAVNERLLQFDDNGAFLEVAIGPQQFEKRRIELGLSDGIHIEVLSGLPPNERIKVW